MRFENYINESSFIENTMNKLKTKSGSIEIFLKDQFSKLSNKLKEEGQEDAALKLINKAFKTNYKSLDEISKGKVQPLKEGTEYLNEDIAHWWDVVKAEAFPTLAFYPALTVWLEIDKLIKGNSADMRTIIVYSVFWILLISGKYIKGWHKWKKENPEEYKKEIAAKRSR